VLNSTPGTTEPNLTLLGLLLLAKYFQAYFVTAAELSVPGWSSTVTAYKTFLVVANTSFLTKH
jgi:hypothetical protein